MMYRRAIAVALAACFFVVIPSIAAADDHRGVRIDEMSAQRVGALARHRVDRLHNLQAERRLIRHKSRTQRAVIRKGAPLELVPELDPNSASASLAFLLGATVLVMQRRRLSA